MLKRGGYPSFGLGWKTLPLLPAFYTFVALWSNTVYIFSPVHLSTTDGAIEVQRAETQREFHKRHTSRLVLG